MLRYLTCMTGQILHQKDFVRIEILCAANDLVCNFINALHIFKIWNLLDDKLLADADGQKFSASNKPSSQGIPKSILVKARASPSTR